jgi:hypothetical protein
MPTGVQRATFSRVGILLKEPVEEGEEEKKSE